MLEDIGDSSKLTEWMAFYVLEYEDANPPEEEKKDEYPTPEELLARARMINELVVAINTAKKEREEANARR